MKSFLAILAAVLSIVCVSAFGEAMYTVTDLGTLVGRLWERRETRSSSGKTGT